MEREPGLNDQINMSESLALTPVINTIQDAHFAIGSTQDKYLENRLAREAQEVDVVTALKHSITRHRARARQHH